MSNDQNRRVRFLAGNSFLLCILISFVLVVYASAIELFRYNLTKECNRRQAAFFLQDASDGSKGSNGAWYHECRVLPD
jgi:hypothetical protein